MPCTGDSAFSSILVAKSLKRNRLILTTNEEIKPTLQGDMMTVGELAEFLQLHPSMRLHPSAIYRLLRQGKLPAFKVGSGWGFSRQAIGRLVQLETRQLSGS
jgi:excisionase family DNA binding protein